LELPAGQQSYRPVRHETLVAAGACGANIDQSLSMLRSQKKPEAQRVRRAFRHSDFLDFWLLTPISRISRAKPLP
jgi:hypothetical protein